MVADINIEAEETARRKEILNSLFQTNVSMNNPLKALTNLHRGQDFLGNSLPVSNGKDDHKLVYMTRPQLNLSDKNVLRVRKMLAALDESPTSIDRYVRVLLDPRLSYGDDDNGQPAIRSDLIDEYCPFMPILSNTLTKMTGWPDVVVPTYTSKPGVMKETYSIIDGVTDIYGENDLDLTFRNTQGETVLKLISLWIQSASNNFSGITKPYMDMLLEFEKDFESRIYVIVLSENRRHIKRVASCMAAFPITDPQGKFFDYDVNGNTRVDNQDFTIRFKGTGFEYNDPVILDEFNAIGEIFNPHLRSLAEGDSDHGLVKIPVHMMPLIGFSTYPRINLLTNELEHYTLKQNLKELPLNEGN